MSERADMHYSRYRGGKGARMGPDLGQWPGDGGFLGLCFFVTVLHNPVPHFTVCLLRPCLSSCNSMTCK